MKKLLFKIFSTKQLYYMKTFVNRIFYRNTNKYLIKTRKVNINKNTFFGYYDKSPFMNNNQNIIVTSTSCDSKDVDNKLDIHLYNFSKEAFHYIDSSSTWNWQQSCRVQPLLFDSKECIIYNDVLEGQYGAKIYDFKSEKVIKHISYPIYDISYNNNMGLSLDFSRLHRLRPGYGYINIPDETKVDPIPIDSGVFVVDIEKNTRRLLISLKELSEIQPDESMTNAQHYINHLSYNPSASRFMFLHLWVTNNKRYGRVITSDINGENLYVMTNQGHASHYCWIDDNQMLLYATNDDGVKGYHIYSHQVGYVKSIPLKCLEIDGHPTVKHNWLLTDTKPDKYGNENILLIDTDNNLIYNLGAYFQPYKYYGEFRCDLHPRFSSDGKYICFDSAHEGQRAMYVMALEDIINRNGGESYEDCISF